jgi:cytochrome c-type biogenesis protein CcmH/NrfG
MFVLLALVFGVGFVAFGVGSDVQGGIADVLGVGGSGTGQPSVDDAQKKLLDNPSNPTALRDLSRALQLEGRGDEAIDPLERFTALKPRDVEARRELAGLYLARANTARIDLQNAQYEAQLLDPSSQFLPPVSSPLGQALGSPPISSAVTSKSNERVNEAYSRLVAAYGSAKTTYQEIVKLTPKDAAAQLQLADAATNSGDTATAIAAYQRFLKLAPDDPSAELVRQEIKRLQRAATPGTSATAG